MNSEEIDGVHDISFIQVNNMLRFLFILLISSLCVFKSYGHNANEAFFTLHETESGYIVQAEFPWTLRNALIKYRPSLEDATNKSDFESALKGYIKEHLQLISNRNISLDLSEIKEIKNTGHSHQNTFEILYIGSSLSRIQNTVLFELYTDQKNYHEINIRDSKFEFTTTAAENSFGFDQQIESKFGFRNLTWPFVILSLIVIFLIIRKKNLNQNE